MSTRAIAPTQPPDLAELPYPHSDGEPMAESPAHVNAIISVYPILLAFLAGQEAMVFANQNLFYEPGNRSKKVVPDCMVILGVKLPGALNYKIWETGIAPQTIFEMTSESTRQEDFVVKKALYERLGVQEYWLFDPQGIWIPEQLLGYELHEGCYRAKQRWHSDVLGLTLVVEGDELGFIDDVTGDRLLNRQAQAERQAKEQALLQAEADRQAKELALAEAAAAQAKLQDLLDRLRQQGIEVDEASLG